jgi:hypothetical protein
VSVRGGAAVIACLGVAGCTTVLRGHVEHPDGDTVIVTEHGKSVRLTFNEETAPVARLDGDLIEVRGSKALGTLHVVDFVVIDGQHGLQVWVGPVQMSGLSLGVADRNSDRWYPFDASSVPDLRARLGQMVIVEGWLTPDFHVHVAYTRVLGQAPPPVP